MLNVGLIKIVTMAISVKMGNAQVDRLGIVAKEKRVVCVINHYFHFVLLETKKWRLGNVHVTSIISYSFFKESVGRFYCKSHFFFFFIGGRGK